MAHGARKLKISDDEEKIVEEAYNKFGDSSLEVPKLFDLFKEWQSLKTRSLKRFTLSLSFLLTIAWIIGIDITTIKPLGISVSGADETKFLISLLIIHVLTFIYYRYQRRVDFNVRNAEIGLFEEDLQDLLPIHDSLDKIISEGRAPSFISLVRDVRGIASTKMPRARKVFDALSFFKEKLKQEENKLKWAELIETLVIYGLSIAALISVAINF